MYKHKTIYIDIYTHTYIYIYIHIYVRVLQCRRGDARGQSNTLGP